jgi:Protein of unknown function (DUF4241)
MLDYAPFFKNSGQSVREFEAVDLGNLFLPTGSVVCCDPFLSHEVSALNRRLEPGDYPVKLCVAKLPKWGKRVALAGLISSNQTPLRWAKASYKMSGSRFSTFRVDSGLACFMDAQTAKMFSKVVHGYYEALPEGNYYDDILDAEFKRSADPAHPYQAGNWTLHFPIKDDPRNIAMFASGLGDGSYSSYWGLGGDDQPSMLVIDFGVLGQD